MLADIYFDNVKDTCLMALIQVITNSNLNQQQLILDYFTQLGLRLNPVVPNRVEVVSQHLNRLVEVITPLKDQTHLALEGVKPAESLTRGSDRRVIAAEGQIIGEGGYGKVYQYKNPIDQNSYAVKRIEVLDEMDENVLREVRILSQLNHRNIVRYYFSWLDDGSNLNIFMELCYCNLQDYLTQRNMGCLELNMMLNCHISREILNGLTYIHQNMLIHGDLSTQNILITRNHEIKIGDFGLTRSLPPAEEFINVSTSVGNPIYLAPEVERGLLYQCSDIYSFGIIIFELINKFKTQHQRRIEIQKLKQNKSRVHTRTGLLVLISKMTRKNPYSRPTLEQIRHSLNQNAIH